MTVDSNLDNLKNMELRSDSEVSDDSDSSVNDDVLIKHFKKCYYPKFEEKVSNKSKNFILNLDLNREQNPKIGLSLTDKSCCIYQLNDKKISKISSFNAHEDSITSVKFAKENNDLFLTSSLDGTIKVWDLRSSTKKYVNIMKDDTNGDQSKPIICFDLSTNDRALCAGTELIGGDSFLLFFDLRCTKLLGGYWESHTDDITQVMFNPSNKNLLTSGSTDGLINVYDLTKTNEDDALIHTFNTESSVEKLKWAFLDDQDYISCITHMHEYQMWKVNDDNMDCQINRDSLAKSILKKSEQNVYLSDTYQTNNNIHLLTGSYSSKDTSLRILYIENNTLKPFSLLKDNKQIVRAAIYNEKDNYLLTAGEDSILNIWNLNENVGSINKNKIKTNQRFKPY